MRTLDSTQIGGKVVAAVSYVFDKEAIVELLMLHEHCGRLTPGRRCWTLLRATHIELRIVR